MKTAQAHAQAQAHTHAQAQAPAARALGLIAGLALAAAAALPPAASAQTGDGFLEEIVVTAQKREQTLREVAASISVVDGERIQELDILRFEDLERVTSGLQLIRQNQRNVTISNRGVFFDPESGSSASVDVYQNGVVQRPDNIFGALYDIERVEILRGPQGSLQGATSPAGAIIVNTARPNMEEVAGYFQASHHDLGENLQGALDLPLSAQNTFGARLAFYTDQNDQNDITNLRTGRVQDAETRSYRASVQWLPNDEVTINVSYQNVDQTLYGTPQLVGTRTNIASAGATADAPPQITPCFIPSMTDGSLMRAPYLMMPLVDARGMAIADERCPQTLTADDDAAYAAADMYGITEADIYTMEWEWNISDEHSMTYVMGYTDSLKSARTENDLSSNLDLQTIALGVPPTFMGPGVVNDTDYLSHQTTATAVETWTHELRLASHDRPFWNYLFGFYLNDQETTTAFRAYSTAARYLPSAFLNTPPSVPAAMQSPVNFTAGHLEGMNIITGGEIPVNAETLALFTAHTFNLGDAWTLEAALRWQQTDGFRQSDINGLGFHQEERITLQNAEGTFKFPITHMGATLVTMGTAVETDVDGEVTMPAITVAQTDPSFVAQATALATVQATLEDIVDGTKRNTLAQANIVGIPLAYQHPEDDAVTGSLSLRWDINDSLTGHVAYNRSYRVGGISVNPGDAPGVENQLYDGETADSVELGVRMLIGGRAEFNLVGYYQLFDGYQGFIRELTYLGVNPATRMPAVQSLSGGLVFNGDMVSTGIDFDWRMLLAESLTLGGTLNWNQSEFDGANVPCNDREAGEIVGYCESSDRIPGSPELQASLFLEWVLNLRQAQFFIRSNNKFSDGILSTRAVGKDDTRPTETGSYTLSDLFIGLRSLNDIWEVSAYAKNLADERTATDLRNPGGGSGTSGNFDPAGYFTEIRRLPPRTYGLRLRYNF